MNDKLTQVLAWLVLALAYGAGLAWEKRYANFWFRRGFDAANVLNDEKTKRLVQAEEERTAAVAAVCSQYMSEAQQIEATATLSTMFPDMQEGSQCES